EDVAEPADHLNAELDAWRLSADVAGVDQQPLTGREVFDDDFAREVEPDGAGAGDALEDEPFAAEQTCAKPLLEGDVELHALLGTEERLLAADDRLARLERERQDVPGKPRRERDARRPLGRVIDDEHP